MLLSPLLSYSQEGNLNFGVQGFFNFSLPFVQVSDNSITWVENGLQPSTNWAPMASGTFFGELKLGESSWLGFGAGYHQYGDQTERIRLVFGNQIDPQLGFVQPDEIVEVRVRYRYHNLEIPVYYKMELGENRYFKGGISSLVYLDNTTCLMTFTDGPLTDVSKSNDSYSQFNAFNLSTNIGYGMDILTNQKLTFFTEFYAQKSWLGMVKDAPVQRNFLSMGIVLGVRMNNGSFED